MDKIVSETFDVLEEKYILLRDLKIYLSAIRNNDNKFDEFKLIEAMEELDRISGIVDLMKKDVENAIYDLRKERP